MTTNKRPMQLTEDQRNKLLKRDELSTTERRDNEFAIRNKLKEFLEFVPDANLILSNLPGDQLKKNSRLAVVLNDQTTYGLFDLLFQLLNLLDFSVAFGPLPKPFAYKQNNYPGPYASRYEAPCSFKTQEELNRQLQKILSQARIEAKTYPKLKPINPEEYERLSYISEYIQALIDHYLSDLNMLERMPSEIKSKKDTRPKLRSYATLEVDGEGCAQYDFRLLKAIEEFGPITESELMLKLFVDPIDKLRSKAFSVQLEELRRFGIILKDTKGWQMKK